MSKDDVYPNNFRLNQYRNTAAKLAEEAYEKNLEAGMSKSALSKIYLKFLAWRMTVTARKLNQLSDTLQKMRDENDSPLPK